MGDTTIQWTDKTWNPVRGCDVVSPGCINCYAMGQAHRFSGPGKPYDGLTKLGGRGPIWNGKVRTIPEMLAQPLRWKKPSRIFVNSMSDLFHEDVPDEYIAAVFGVMAACPQHTFQVLTKRADRLPKWFAWLLDQARGFIHGVQGFLHVMVEKFAGQEVADRAWNAAIEDRNSRHGEPQSIGDVTAWPWPLPNVWLGVSVEDQQRADERIPHLLKVPAAVQFLSVEPLLEAVDLSKIVLEKGGHLPGAALPRPDLSIDALHGWHGGADPDRTRIDWVIVGGESGRNARPFDLAWARQIIEQCRTAAVPVFMKQIGRNPVCNGKAAQRLKDPFGDGIEPWRTLEDADGNDLMLKDSHGGDPSEWPEDLRVRQFPEVAHVE